MTNKLDEIKKHYGESLTTKLDQLQQIWSALNAQSGDTPENLSDFYAAVHKLAGSSGMYGYDTIHAHAQALDAVLRRQLPVETDNPGAETASKTQPGTIADASDRKSLWQALELALQNEIKQIELSESS